MTLQVKLILVLFIITELSGCRPRYLTNPTKTVTSRTTTDRPMNIIYRSSNSKSDYLQITKVINSTCYCADVIAERYVNHRLLYRFYYGCSIYKTRKEVFSYCSQGAVIGPRIFDGVTSEEFDIPLDKTDKFIIHKIDSFIKTDIGGSQRLQLCRKNITGFRRVLPDSTLMQSKR